MKNKSNVNGITLIALIITVIVLLILAGAAVNIGLRGDDVFAKANKAREEWNSKVEEEDRAMQELMEILSPNPNVLNARQLNENANTYFGWDVINYAETLPENLRNIEWQLLYAGPLEGSTEQRIYLISKEYVNYTQLPKKNEVSLMEVNNGSGKCAKFGGDDTNGIMPQYNGSSDITQERIKRLNKKYFDFLTNYNLSSTESGIKAVAYMLDTEIWSDYVGNDAEFAIGGPTLELLFTAYNKYKNLAGQQRFETSVNDVKGYDYTNPSTLENDTQEKNNPFSTSSIPNTSGYVNGYNIASPCGHDKQYIMSVNATGYVGAHSHYNSSGWAFRPVVVLKSDKKLEKIIQERRECFYN